MFGPILASYEKKNHQNILNIILTQIIYMKKKHI